MEAFFNFFSNFYLYLKNKKKNKKIKNKKK